jgi:hypothetical protein
VREGGAGKRLKAITITSVGGVMHGRDAGALRRW